MSYVKNILNSLKTFLHGQTPSPCLPYSNLVGSINSSIGHRLNSKPLDKTRKNVGIYDINNGHSNGYLNNMRISWGPPLSGAEGVGHRCHPMYAYHVAYTMYNECKLAIAQVQIMRNMTHHKPKSCITWPKLCLGSIKMYVGSTQQTLDAQKGSQGKKEASNTFVFQVLWAMLSQEGVYYYVSLDLWSEQRLNNPRLKDGFTTSNDTNRLSS